MCTAYSKLPSDGGILDQSPYLLHGLKCVVSAIDIKEEQEQSMQAQRAKHRSKRMK